MSTLHALQGTLQEKERSLRKTEQELESLVFRNKQLSSRVEVLQRELDTAASAAKHKKHKVGISVPSLDNHVSNIKFCYILLHFIFTRTNHF